MSARFDASGDSLKRTTNLPTITAWTVMGWAYLVASANTYNNIFSVGKSSAGSSYYCTYTNSSRVLYVYSGTGAGVAGSTLSLGTWYHIAMVCSGTGAGNLVLYLNGVADITTSGSIYPTMQAIMAGNDPDSDYMTGRLAAVKIWSAALSATEIAQEMYSISPRRFENLNGFYPIWPGDRTTDYSGNGNLWTENGTLTDEDPPPVSYGVPIIVYPITAAAGTIYTQSVAGALTDAGVIARRGQKALELATAVLIVGMALRLGVDAVAALAG